MKILLYSTQTSTRLSYIIDFFSKQINAEIAITNDIELFHRSDDIRINYSSSSLTHQEFWIQPHALIFEKNIQLQQTDCFKWNDLKAFFKTGGDIQFDIFSATFYLLSRYEEYLPHDKDMYGRYAHTNSIAFKENFLSLPLINLWIEEFKKLLKQKFPSFTIHNSPFTFQPTYDIDIAYAYRNHPFLKNTMGLSKDLGTANFKNYFQRFFAMIGLGGDPFDTYQWLDALHVKYQLHPYYFFLLAESRKGYDKNLSPRTNAMRGLIKAHDAKYKIGIHPSWQSGDDENILNREISILENIIGKTYTE